MRPEKEVELEWVVWQRANLWQREDSWDVDCNDSYSDVAMLRKM